MFLSFTYPRISWLQLSMQYYRYSSRAEKFAREIKIDAKKNSCVESLFDIIIEKAELFLKVFAILFIFKNIYCIVILVLTITCMRAKKESIQLRMKKGSYTFTFSFCLDFGLVLVIWALNSRKNTQLVGFLLLLLNSLSNTQCNLLYFCAIQVLNFSREKELYFAPTLVLFVYFFPDKNV
jgi:hypothetical protein